MTEEQLAAIEERAEDARLWMAQVDANPSDLEPTINEDVPALVAEVRRLRNALGCIARYGPRVQLPTAISCAHAALAGNPQPCSYLHEHGDIPCAPLEPSQ